MVVSLIIAHIWAIVNIQAIFYHVFITESVVIIVIVYDRLWKTMREKGISQYKLIQEYHFSTGQLDRLRKNDNLSTHTLNELCRILDCSLEEIAEYRKDSEKK